MKSGFFAELKRRHVYRAGVIYAMVSWLLIQIATQVFPFFEIPHSVVRLIILILVLGFPIALALAWAFELTPEGIVKTDELPPEKSHPWRANRRLDFVIIGLLAVAIVFLLFFRIAPLHKPTPLAGVPPKSIAVLPFENIGDDKENAFFADGIQDDILTSLAKIGDLKVISRTSVMQYRGTVNRNTREIGGALGVANLLEGSVRRERNHVVVNVQLIDARDDRHVWADRYDRTLEDSLGLQGELATEIAQTLHATLSPEEKEQVARKPTENADAYVLYLRAFELEHGPDTLLQDYKIADELYTQAIALDPAFALAHAHLASTSAEIFHFHEPLDSWKTKARSEAAEALRLQPDLAEGHFALGQCLYWMDENYEAALQELAIAARLAPNNADVGVLVAAIQRRQGRWQESLDAYQRIEKLDPQNPNIVRNLVFTNTALRRWPEAARAAERWRAMAPDSLVAKIQAGYVDFWWKGDTRSLKNLLASVPVGTDPDGMITACRWESALIDRDFDAAENALQNSPLESVDYLNGGSTPKTFLAGCVLLARGDAAAATPLFDQARVKFEAAAQESPNIAECRANLGLVYAFLGRKEDAIREGRRAVELKPESKDAYDGAIISCYLALIYARVGEPDLAFPLIERLLKTPGAVDSTDYSITRNDLRRRWEWDPLRNDARFEKLIAKSAGQLD
jgi:TolB-like protein/Flp pilus assembly protein TadD